MVDFSHLLAACVAVAADDEKREEMNALRTDDRHRAPKYEDVVAQLDAVAADLGVTLLWPQEGKASPLMLPFFFGNVATITAALTARVRVHRGD